MKLIAVIDNGFLAEVTEEEIALLRGYRGTYAPEYRRLPEPDIGDEFDIQALTNKAAYLRELDADVLAKAESRFLQLSAEVRGVRELVQKLNLFEELKD